MKRIISLLCALLLLAAMLPASASIDVPSQTMYVKTPDGKTLDLHEQPDAKAKVIDKIPYAAEVQVYSDFLGMVWYHVQYGMLNGYVKTEFLSEKKPKPIPTPKPKPTSKPTSRPKPTAKPVPSHTMYVKTANGNSLNLREQPDANAKVIAKIPYATEVLVYSDFVGMVWYHVQYGMFNGYVKTEFLSQKKPKPYVTPTPNPTVKPTATAAPSPEEETAREIAAAHTLGLVPQGVKSEGNITWQELDQLLTNAIRLKNKNSSAIRSHVYLSLAEYQAANAGQEFDIVLRGVAAAEMYGALMDMGESDPAFNHSHDPYVSDADAIELCQQYAGVWGNAAGDWRALPMLDMVLTILDNADAVSGKPVMALDMDHDFHPNNPLTRAEAIQAAYRLYNSFYQFLGEVTVTHRQQANLRAQPSMDADIVGKVNPGEVYNVVSIPSTNWYQIQLANGKTAYIAAGMVAFRMN